MTTSPHWQRSLGIPAPPRGTTAHRRQPPPLVPAGPKNRLAPSLLASSPGSRLNHNPTLRRIPSDSISLGKSLGGKTRLVPVDFQKRNGDGGCHLRSPLRPTWGQTGDTQPASVRPADDWASADRPATSTKVGENGLGRQELRGVRRQTGLVLVDFQKETEAVAGPPSPLCLPKTRAEICGQPKGTGPTVCNLCRGRAGSTDVAESGFGVLMRTLTEARCRSPGQTAG